MSIPENQRIRDYIESTKHIKERKTVVDMVATRFNKTKEEAEQYVVSWAIGDDK